MKTSLLLTLTTAALALSGCAICQRSGTWDAVVRSRAEYSGDSGSGAKDGYINRLHQVLSHAGVEHKIVTYQFHYRNAYREDSVQTAVAVIYRDDWNARNPWWVMDEYRHVPVWLPSWPLDAQLEFFLQRDVEVLEEKTYAAAGRPVASEPVRRSLHREVASVPKPRKPRTAFASGPRQPPARPAADATAANVDPLSATTLTGGGPDDSRASALFRATHGTPFDRASAVDRQKMQALKRQLFDRNRNAQLRSE